jgi:hypothetical protein
MLLIMTLIVAASVHDPCLWDHPGADPYRSNGDVITALKDYKLPTVDMQLIKKKMSAYEYDDMVSITREAISGSPKQHVSYSNLRDMHSGHSVCNGPVKISWASNESQLGLVYCGTGDTCVVVPLICDNVALLTRKQEQELIPPAVGGVDPEGSSELSIPIESPLVESTQPPVLVEVFPLELDTEWTTGSPGFVLIGGGGGPIVGVPAGPKQPSSCPPCPCTEEPIPPIGTVPELPINAMLIVGLVGLLVRVRFR